MKECSVCHRCFADEFSHCPTDGDELKQTLAGEPVLDGRYQLESRLGHGGMGIVFRARHIFLKTSHAIKVVLPDLVGNDPTLATRFRQEAMAAAAIRHPNIIAVTDFGVTRGTMPFLVMEFVKGKSLHDLLAERSRLSVQQTFEIIAAVCAGVGAAHKQGIVHRDLKPLNIMLQDDLPMSDAVKVLDFGLAKIKSGELLGSFVQAQTTGLMGSPYYMAPEQWSDDEPDRRADIYSLGIIIFQMLAGDVPFKGSSMPSIMKKHLTSAPPSLSVIGINVPPQTEAVIARALAKNPDERPQTVEELVVELRQSLGLTGASPHLERTHLGPAAGGAAAPFDPLATNLMSPATGGATGAPLSSSPPRTVGDQTAATGGVGEQHTRHDRRETAAAPPPPPQQQSTPGGAAARGGELTNLGGGIGGEDKAATAGGQSTGNFDRAQNTGAIDDRRRADASSRPPSAATHYDYSSSSAPPSQFEATNRQDRGVFAQTANSFSAAPEGARGAGRATVYEAQPPANYATETPPAVYDSAPAPQKSRTLLIAAFAVIALLLIGGGGFVLYRVVTDGDDAVETGESTDGIGNKPTPEVTPRVVTPRVAAPEMVGIPGGKFMMGSSEVAGSEKSEDLVIAPAHPVTVANFLLQKTEVTNAAYAEFVRASDHQAPEGWSDGVPPSGQELWPVRNVSLDDALTYADWRSQQDKVTYRLPTEEEWEYAARNGGQTKRYPWGDDWVEGQANISGGGPVIVGSFPQGANRWGVLDLIGNVSEWTSSKASFYPGHDDRLKLPDEQRDYFIMRGGSYLSKETGGRLVSAFTRAWYLRSRRNPIFGFRLARDNP